MISCPKKILIAEDSSLISSRVVKMLNRSRHVVSIFPAQTYEQAITILQRELIDIALLDIHLRESSGIDLLRFAKNQLPGICVVMFTNQSDRQVERLCKELGAEHFLDKAKDFPFLPQLIDSLL
jgi:DNA-binding response OmpR family regulator